MRIIVFFIIVLFFPVQVFAQLEYNARVEFNTTPTADEEFDVLPLSKDGLLVTHRKDEFYGNEKWTFHRYDSTLKESWNIEYKLERDVKPLRFFYNQNHLYWLFKDSDHNERFSILRLDLVRGETDVFKGSIHTDVEISHFKVLGNLALMGGYYNSKPVVMTFSFFDKSVKILPYLLLNNTEISDVEIDEAHNEIVVVLYSMQKRKCQLTLKYYSYDGKLLKTLNPTFEQDHGLISGKVISLSNNNSLLVGNYAQGCTQYSQGIYFSRIHDGDLEPIQWVDFSQLENFFNYLKPKRKQKMIERITKRKESGKEPKFRYKIIVHDIIETANEYVFTAEIYYPTISTNTNAVLGSTRRSDENQSYRYTHAFVCGIDKNTGQLTWDNCLDLNEIESKQLLEITQITEQNNKLILAYPNKGKINTAVIAKNKVLREREEFEIKTTASNEKITDNEDEELAAWYNNNFLLFGYQKVMDEKGRGDKREVFSVSKVIYDTNVPIKNDNKKPSK